MWPRETFIATCHPDGVPCSVYFMDGGTMQWLFIRTEVFHDYNLADVDIYVENSIPVKGDMAAGSETVEMESSVFLRGW